MHVVSGVRRQKFRRIFDCHVINSTLHWTKEMVIKVRNMDCLVDHQVKHLTGIGVIISNCPANGGKCFSAKVWAVPPDNNRSIKVKGNQGT